MDKHVVIIGASVAGVGAANELRACGFAGRITLLDVQPHLPYDRPPLSKAVLVDDEAHARLGFHAGEHYASAGIELRTGCAVLALDAAARTLALATGETLRADVIVIATGARARVLPGTEHLPGVVTVRGVDDAVRLKQELRSARKLAVVGGGFVGAEVASSARKLGIPVDVYEAEAWPFLRILGQDIAARLARFHTDAGVHLVTGVRVVTVTARQPSGYTLALSSGETRSADVVVVGLGAVPNVEFLADSGVEVADGVVCDAFGHTSVPGVYAAGDVANWPNVHGGPRHRDEHWTSAREQARIVAHGIAGQATSAWGAYVPYFWSDLYGRRVQVLGTPQYADAVRLVFEDPEKGAFVAEYLSDGELIAVAGCAAAVRVAKYRARLPRPPRQWAALRDQEPAVSPP